MQEYAKIARKATIEQPEDIITAEEFKYDENAHPRSVMTLRRSNGIPYPYLVQTIIRIIIDGDNRDPVTRCQLSQLTRQRAILFSRCVHEFPDYRLDPTKTVDLYNRWINSYKPECTLSPTEKSRLQLEAQCFLQAEDLMDIFQSFSGKGSLDNRDASEQFLIDSGKKWVLRHSSLKDTEYNKAYALTQIAESGYFTHVAIVHRVGEGFFSHVALNRGDSTADSFDYFGSYPTIIHLLMAEVPELA
jgi:hypothetical protein